MSRGLYLWGVLCGAIIGMVVTGLVYDTAGSPSNLHVQTVYVRNLSQFVSDREVTHALPAFQKALSHDFAPIWHVDAHLVFVGGRMAPSGSSTITLVNKGPVKGALAFHEIVNGVPDSIIYIGTSRYFGYAWTVGFTHELWEMLADPEITSLALGLVPSQWTPPGSVWIQEVADPVENDKDAFLVDGVLISDFIGPRWFGAPDNGPIDFAGRLQYPLTLTKGSYAQYYVQGFGWTLVDTFRNARDRGFYAGEGLERGK